MTAVRKVGFWWPSNVTAVWKHQFVIAGWSLISRMLLFVDWYSTFDVGFQLTRCLIVHTESVMYTVARYFHKTAGSRQFSISVWRNNFEVRFCERVVFICGIVCKYGQRTWFESPTNVLFVVLMKDNTHNLR